MVRRRRSPVWPRPTSSRSRARGAPDRAGAPARAPHHRPVRGDLPRALRRCRQPAAHVGEPRLPRRSTGGPVRPPGPHTAARSSCSHRRRRRRRSTTLHDEVSRLAEVERLDRAAALAPRLPPRPGAVGAAFLEPERAGHRRDGAAPGLRPRRPRPASHRPLRRSRRRGPSQVPGVEPVTTDTRCR